MQIRHSQVILSSVNILYVGQVDAPGKPKRVWRVDLLSRTPILWNLARGWGQAPCRWMNRPPVPSTDPIAEIIQYEKVYIRPIVAHSFRTSSSSPWMMQRESIHTSSGH